MIKTCQWKGCSHKYVSKSHGQKYCKDIQCIHARQKAQKAKDKLRNGRTRDISRRKLLTKTLPIQTCRYCEAEHRSRFDVCPSCRERVLKAYTYDAILVNNVDFINA